MNDHADDPGSAGEMADRLLDTAFGAGDVDGELARVADGDAPAVLDAVIRAIAALVASRRVGDHVDVTPPDGSAPDGIASPWSADDSVTETLVSARLLFDALAGQANVGGLLRGVRAIDEDEARAVVLERALAAMAERPGNW